jgi:16S rRNA (uracil1498-N3)-methyltransferase
MTRRYFVPELQSTGGTIALPDAESQHAIRVMRIKVGDAIELFNGKGLQSDAVVTQVDRNHCICESQAPQLIDREPAKKVRMGIALPKPDRAKELIERLTELGIHHVTPIVAERTQRGPTESSLDKLRKVIIEGCKQSGRNHLLEIGRTTKSHDYFQQESSQTKLIAHVSENGISPLSFLNGPESETISVAIGPEGGWTETEYESAVKNGFASVNLGKRIYRIETASVSLASILVT